MILTVNVYFVESFGCFYSTLYAEHCHIEQDRIVLHVVNDIVLLKYHKVVVNVMMNKYQYSHTS
jgi:hypothetical protein